ncbi:biofilm peroxide resistance protein BsmA [Erwiniaceae bacterium BAC15a-03b]|uniref:Biofilm peroxide resistance protein BsmA n=1 Tax=Winslowiella arboricola TaxID=2978220 RepID=A0A9J6PNZ0_9GAMM|nr:biofilm peroxide resistance protein BsmA [Winslowiella arboricola]MCU5773631.1 biofilm peroxide resistance protein BsmA [Winslowiella arboricola]MCU5778470.1 biofilm peroxide resistance protein BsmA [Winslowiella arboricola]
MRIAITFLLALLLSSCSALTPTPQAPPPPASQAQEITRAQSSSLTKVGTISATSRGSPDDVQRAIAAKANASGATYYQIVMVSETVMPGLWYATAVLFNPSAAGSTQQ